MLKYLNITSCKNIITFLLGELTRTVITVITVQVSVALRAGISFNKKGLINPFLIFSLSPEDPQAILLYKHACDVMVQGLKNNVPFSILQEECAIRFGWEISSVAFHQMGSILLSKGVLTKEKLVYLTDIPDSSIFYVLPDIAPMVPDVFPAFSTSAPLAPETVLIAPAVIEVAPSSWPLVILVGVTILVVGVISYYIYTGSHASKKEIEDACTENITKTDPDVTLYSPYEPSEIIVSLNNFAYAIAILIIFSGGFLLYSKISGSFGSLGLFINHKFILTNTMLIVSSIFIISLSFLSWMIPLFSFIVACIFSSLLLFLSLPFQNIKQHQTHVMSLVINQLHKYHVLNFLAVLYIQFFFVPKKLFKKRLYVVFGISLLYLLISRWYFITTKIDGTILAFHISLLVFLVLFIGICISYFRFLLNIASFIIPVSVQHYPYLLEPAVLYVFGDDSSESKTPLNLGDSGSKKSFININRSRHYYRQYYSGTHNNTFRYAGFFIRLCTLGATTAAAYYRMLA